VGGFGAFFLLLDEPEVYGLPPDPQDPTHDLGSIWGAALAAAGALLAATAWAFRGASDA
jgi:formate dehydrogenase iron-sulfur subunit